MERFELRLLVRLIAVAIVLCVIAFAITWPYGPWVALGVGAIVFAWGMAQAKAMGAHAYGIEQDGGGVGAGMVDELRNRGVRRATFGAILAVAGAGGVLYQLAA